MKSLQFIFIVENMLRFSQMIKIIQSATEVRLLVRHTNDTDYNMNNKETIM